MKIYTLGILLFIALSASAQVSPSFAYDFDQCSVAERNGNLSDLVVAGNLVCDCGPVTEGVSFDGSLAMQMEKPGDLLEQNFTLSFYINPPTSGPQQMIMSNARTCNERDSILDIRFFPFVNTISIQVADFGGVRALIEAPLNDDKCWQHIALVKDGRILRLYINGLLVETFQGDQPIDINSNAPFVIGATLCGPGQGPQNFTGDLDEIEWYDRVLDPLEISDLFRPMDEILTSDTLLFLGDSFIPTVSNTCANSIAWTPGVGLSSTSIIDPEIGPTQTTKYNISFNYSGCTALDSINVTVIDPSLIDCDNLLLPTAFTPNGDNLNDTYFISNGYIIEDLKYFQIMDRAGNSLWEAQNASDEWDGVYKGRLMTSGSYVYRVVYQCGGNEIAKVGSFNIMR